LIELDATRRSIPGRAMGAPATGRLTFGKSILLAFVAYAFLSAMALSLLLYEFYRLEETAAGILLKSFAQVTAEQTGRTIQNIGETLEFVDGAFALPGKADTDLSVERRLQDILSKHPYMRAIWIVDGKGIIVGGSERGASDWISPIGRISGRSRRIEMWG
jgi:hypothetical protein